MRSPLLVVAGVLLLAGCGESGGKPSDKPASAAETRLVGHLHAAVEVPSSWSTNESSCGTPMVDTVVVDVAADPLCNVPRPRGIESVQLEQTTPRDFTADQGITIDGVKAERQLTSCIGDLEARGLCAGMIRVPSEGVTFRATSSTSKAAVDKILDGVQIVKDKVGVPGFSEIDVKAQAGAGGSAGTMYAKVLRDAGLAPTIVEEQGEPGVPAGYVLDASPSPGTMVAPGEKVTIHVAAKG